MIIKKISYYLSFLERKDYKAGNYPAYDKNA